MTSFFLSREPWGQRAWGSTPWAPVLSGPTSGVVVVATLADTKEAFGPGAGQANLGVGVNHSLAASGLTVTGIPFGLTATVTLASAPSSVIVVFLSHNPGYQYVRDIPSFGLPDGHRTYQAVGAPSANLGNAGDYYRRLDGTAGTLMYYRGASSWTAIN